MDLGFGVQRDRNVLPAKCRACGAPVQPMHSCALHQARPLPLHVPAPLSLPANLPPCVPMTWPDPWSHLRRLAGAAAPSARFPEPQEGEWLRKFTADQAGLDAAVSLQTLLFPSLVARLVGGRPC